MTLKIKYLTKIRVFFLNLKITGLEDFTQVVMKVSVLWDITPCSPLTVNERLGGSKWIALLADCFMLVSCLASSSSLNEEVT
jgi:hypothetical protein